MSNKTRGASEEGFVPPRTLLAMQLLLGTGVILCVYLLWLSLGGRAVAGCGPESGCREVLRSRWAYWFGIPVSVPALILYLALLAGTLQLHRARPPALQRQTWRWMIPCSVMAIGAALWFGALQIFVLKRACPFCLGTHAAVVVAAGLLLRHAPFRPVPEKSWQQEKQIYVPPQLAKKLCLWAGVGMVGLLAGQILHQKKQFVVAPASASVTGASGSANVRAFELFDGALRLNLNEVPLMGTPAAPHVMLSLFDYTCHHCRDMHAQLLQVQRALGGRLAIVNLPMPLDPACNPMLRATLPDHTNACEYARLGLAVWRADRDKMLPFDDWVFGPPRPPPTEMARIYAASLVGTNALAEAMRSDWINAQLQQSLAIYATNTLLGRGSMPSLIIGTNTVSGSVRGVEDIYALLEQNFGLKPAVLPLR